MPTSILLSIQTQFKVYSCNLPRKYILISCRYSHTVFGVLFVFYKNYHFETSYLATCQSPTCSAMWRTTSTTRSEVTEVYVTKCDNNVLCIRHRCTFTLFIYACH